MLYNAVLIYNSRFKAAKNWSFASLISYLDDELADNDRRYFFDTTLPCILSLVQNTRYFLNKPIPLFRRQSNKTITLNQLQCACILANSFLCTWSRRNSYKADSEYANFPMINFNAIFSGRDQTCKEKIKCLIQYFDTICLRLEDNHKFGNITFERRSVFSAADNDENSRDQVLNDYEVPEDSNIIPIWKNSKKKVNSISINIHKKISIHSFQDSLQADFANKFLGGGVIGSGCVQEEIMFTVMPELMVGMLFNEVMADNEAIVITGVEQYSKYTGYGHTFRYDGPNRVDILNRDAAGRNQVQICALDALNMYEIAEDKKNSEEVYTSQFTEVSLERELNKCYAAIHVVKDLAEPYANLPPFATGKWGCGAFGGDTYAKFLIQVCACIEANRDMNFCCFDEDVEELKANLSRTVKVLQKSKKTVSDIFKLITNYGLDLKEGRVKLDYCEFWDYLDNAIASEEDRIL